MHDLVAHGLSVFFGLFAIMNPIANTPVFIGLTSADDKATVRQVARNSLLLTFILVAVFCVLGRMIFELFGITLPAFRIMGGVLVALIGYHMLQGGPSDVQQPQSSEGSADRDSQLSVAITPLAMPILAGPGTIATAMSFVAEGGVDEILVTLVAFLALCLITFVCFVWGEKLIAYLGKAGVNVLTRLMGLILAVIGVQMLIEGLKGAFPVLGS
jgi:multiple antibiotic resistance protein